MGRARVAEAVWVHGNTFVAQHPGANEWVQGVEWSKEFGLRRGPGIVFRLPSHQQNFFHTSIPTPTRVPIFFPVPAQVEPPPAPTQNYRAVAASLASVSLRMSKSGDIGVNGVQVFDGERRIFGQPLPAPVGGAPTTVTLSPPAPTALSTGVGISVDVGSGDGPGEITFIAAGATFVIAGVP